MLARMTLQEKLHMVYGTDSGVFAGEISGISRLGIPALHLQDGSAGVRMTGTTALPAPLGMAASWNPAMAALYGTVLAQDSRAKAVDVILAPMVNLDRTAQAGRNFESLGEDPWLASHLVAPEVAAIEQGHVIATTKHYAVNNQENGRLRDSSDVDMRTFHELYLPAFAAASQAGTGAVMCSYNRIDGEWACQNKQTLGILTQQVHFPGFVMSDWGATESTVAAANAGLDMEMPGGDNLFGADLARAVASGQISHTRLDDQVRRILHSMLAADLFRYAPQPGTVPVEADNRAARQIAEQGAVLLKNTGQLLPLHGVPSIALIGAAMDADLRGGSAWVQGTGTISPLTAIRAAVGAHIPVTYTWAAGVPFINPLPTLDARTLSPPDAAAGQHGIAAAYYGNATLSGAPKLIGIEPTVDVNWQFAAPRRMTSHSYSVRWTGTFIPPTSGVYTLGVESRGGARLIFEGARVADAWKPSYSIQAETFTRSLVAGHAYPLVVEAHGDTDSYQMCRLLWRPPAGTRSPDIAQAVAAARQADIAIVFVGEFQTEQYDRPTIALTGEQEALIQAVARANPRTVVVLQNGGPVAAGAWAGSVPAILDIWYPGQQYGPALADLLFGKTNPSGKLPVSFPALATQIAAPVGWAAEPYSGPARDIDYKEKLDIGYRWYQAHGIQPLFPFGFGLSYTTFRFDGLSVRTTGTQVEVRAAVTNTGTLPGAEVAQLYLTYPAAAGEPPRVLRGFSRVQLAPGQSQPVLFTLQPQDISIWNTQQQDWQQVPGTYGVAVGSSSTDLPLHAQFTRTTP